MTLGLPLPQAGLEIARAQLSPSSFAAVVYGAMTQSPEEAARLGLVDELADPERVVEVALERARAWSRHPSVAFHHTKAALRDPVLLRIRDRHDQHEEEWVDLWFSPPAQERIAQVREKLLAKKPA
jgi:enoyl-CoA hydratase